MEGNAIFHSWIMNAVSKELFAGFVYSTSAHIPWKDLKDCLDKITGSRIFVIHRKINSLIQGSSTISVYFSRSRQAWMNMIPWYLCQVVKVGNNL